MSTLYEITGEYLELLEMLEESDDVKEQAIKDTLDGIEGELEIKANGYAKVIKELTSEAKKFEEEKKRMELRQSALENRIKILKNHLLNSMKITGKEKFKTELFSFCIQKNGGKQPLELLPDIAVPDEFTKKEPDNEKIRGILENGQTLLFAVLKERGEHLRIR